MDIIATILSITKEGTVKTQIMYKANLSFKQLNKYVNFISRRKLISAHESSHGVLYKTTVKGHKFLQDYKKIKEVLSETLENQFGK